MKWLNRHLVALLIFAVANVVLAQTASVVAAAPGTVTMTPTSTDVSSCKLYRISATNVRTLLVSTVSTPVTWKVPVTQTNVDAPVKLVAFCTSQLGVKSDEVFLQVQWRLAEVAP